MFVSVAVALTLGAAPGACVEKHFVKGEKEPLYVYDLKYDEKQHLIEQRQRPTKYDQGTHWTFAYDDAGRLVREDFPDMGQIVIHSWDAAGRETRITEYPGDVTLPPGRIRTFTFDAAGRKAVEEDDRDGNGRPNRRITFEYDSAGRLVRETSVGVDDPGSNWNDDIMAHVTQVTTHTYDAEGNRIRSEDGGGWITYGYECWKAKPARATGSSPKKAGGK